MDNSVTPGENNMSCFEVSVLNSGNQVSKRRFDATPTTVTRKRSNIVTTARHSDSSQSDSSTSDRINETVTNSVHLPTRQQQVPSAAVGSSAASKTPASVVMNESKIQMAAKESNNVVTTKTYSKWRQKACSTSEKTQRDVRNSVSLQTKQQQLLKDAVGCNVAVDSTASVATNKNKTCKAAKESNNVVTTKTHGSCRKKGSSTSRKTHENERSSVHLPAQLQHLLKDAAGCNVAVNSPASVVMKKNKTHKAAKGSSYSSRRQSGSSTSRKKQKNVKNSVDLGMQQQQVLPDPVDSKSVANSPASVFMKKSKTQTAAKAVGGTSNHQTKESRKRPLAKDATEALEYLKKFEESILKTVREVSQRHFHNDGNDNKIEESNLKSVREVSQRKFSNSSNGNQIKMPTSAARAKKQSSLKHQSKEEEGRQQISASLSTTKSSSRSVQSHDHQTHADLSDAGIQIDEIVDMNRNDATFGTVTGVTPHSPADRAGIQVGDVIYKKRKYGDDDTMTIATKSVCFQFKRQQQQQQPRIDVVNPAEIQALNHNDKSDDQVRQENGKTDDSDKNEASATEKGKRYLRQTSAAKNDDDKEPQIESNCEKNISLSNDQNSSIDRRRPMWSLTSLVRHFEENISEEVPDQQMSSTFTTTITTTATTTTTTTTEKNKSNSRSPQQTWLGSTGFSECANADYLAVFEQTTGNCDVSKKENVAALDVAALQSKINNTSTENVDGSRTKEANENNIRFAKIGLASPVLNNADSDPNHYTLDQANSPINGDSSKKTSSALNYKSHILPENVDNIGYEKRQSSNLPKKRDTNAVPDLPHSTTYPLNLLVDEGKTKIHEKDETPGCASYGTNEETKSNANSFECKKNWNFDIEASILKSVVEVSKKHFHATTLASSTKPTLDTISNGRSLVLSQEKNTQSTANHQSGAPKQTDVSIPTRRCSLDFNIEASILKSVEEVSKKHFHVTEPASSTSPTLNTISNVRSQVWSQEKHTQTTAKNQSGASKHAYVSLATRRRPMSLACLVQEFEKVLAKDTSEKTSLNDENQQIIPQEQHTSLVSTACAPPYHQINSAVVEQQVNHEINDDHLAETNDNRADNAIENRYSSPCSVAVNNKSLIERLQDEDMTDKDSSTRPNKRTKLDCYGNRGNADDESICIDINKCINSKSQIEGMPEKEDLQNTSGSLSKQQHASINNRAPPSHTSILQEFKEAVGFVDDDEDASNLADRKPATSSESMPGDKGARLNVLTGSRDSHPQNNTLLTSNDLSAAVSDTIDLCNSHDKPGNHHKKASEEEVIEPQRSPYKVELLIREFHEALENDGDANNTSLTNCSTSAAGFTKRATVPQSTYTIPSVCHMTPPNITKVAALTSSKGERETLSDCVNPAPGMTPWGLGANSQIPMCYNGAPNNFFRYDAMTQCSPQNLYFRNPGYFFNQPRFPTIPPPVYSKPPWNERLKSCKDDAKLWTIVVDKSTNRRGPKGSGSRKLFNSLIDDLLYRDNLSCFPGRNFCLEVYQRWIEAGGNFTSIHHPQSKVSFEDSFKCIRASVTMRLQQKNSKVNNWR